MSSSVSSSMEIDPLLRDLSEKKQTFRRNVVSLAAELKDVRIRLSSQEESFAKESLTRQACVLCCLMKWVMFILIDLILACFLIKNSFGTCRKQKLELRTWKKRF